MPRFKSSLKNLKVASPCSANWDEMFGDDRTRFCGECKLNVYNLSEMKIEEAEGLLLTSEDRLCVRFYQRSDGTILTADCPVGWAKVRDRLSVYATAAFSMLITMLGGLFSVSLFGGYTESPKYKPLPANAAPPEPLDFNPIPADLTEEVGMIVVRVEKPESKRRSIKR